MIKKNHRIIIDYVEKECPAAKALQVRNATGQIWWLEGYSEE